MTIYYHSAQIYLDPNSIIQPGNWGRVLNKYKYSDNSFPWLIAREMVFESVRAAQFSTLPSRLSCAYVFENRSDADRYMSAFTPWNILYEVEFVDPDAMTHRGCFDLASNPNPACDFIPEVAQRAMQYWSGTPVTTPEIMTKSALRVIRAVSSLPVSYQP